MAPESLISYWLDVREFRLNLKKVVVPFKVFFRINEDYTNNNPSVEIPNFKVEI
jgi:hypothetical protein